MYTTILWDLDQTLLDFRKSMEYALRFCFEKLGLFVDDDIVNRYEGINDSYWRRYELGEIGKETVKLGRFTTLFEELEITQYKAEDIAGIYQKALGSVVFFLEDADKLVAEFKEEGFRQYVLTNGVNATQKSKMELSGLNRLVDGVFVSELIGYPKPRKEFYDACFAALPEVSRKECLVVGDSLTSDIQGANNAGVDACWYNPEGKENTFSVTAAYEIRHLREVRKIIAAAER